MWGGLVKQPALPTVDNTFYFAFELGEGDAVIINNNFPLDSMIGVGGETRPANARAVLAPVLSLVALLGVLAVGAGYARRRGAGIP